MASCGAGRRDGTICRLDLDRNDVRQWSLEDDFGGLIHRLEPDGDRLLVATEYGLDIIEPDVAAPTRVYDGWTYAIFRDPRTGTRWLSTHTGVHVLDGETDTVRRHCALTGRARFGVVDGALIAATSSAAYRVTDDGVAVLAEVVTSPRVLWVGSGLTGDPVLCGYNGFHAIPGLDETSAAIATEPRLDLHQVSAVHRDRLGQFWIGTRGGGLVRLRSAPVTLRAVLPNVNEPYAVESDPDSGVIWAAVKQSLVRLDDGRNVTIATGGGAVDGALIRRRDGTLLWSTNVGVRAFVNDVETPAQVWDPSAVELGVVHDFVEDDTGDLWMAADTGLWRWTGDGVPVPIRHEGRALTGAAVVNVDAARAVWCANDREVWRYDLARGAVGLVHAIDDARAGSSVRAVCTALSGRACLGTYGAGLVIVEDDRVRRITTEDGLPENVITALHVDRAQDAVWMLGNRGVYRLSFAAWRDFIERGAPFPRYRSFTSEDGMVEGSRGAPAIATLPDGRVAFSTIEGVALLRDPVGTPRLSSPRVAMMIVDGEPIPALPGTELHVPAESRRLEFDCSVVNLVAPSDTWFSFRLGDDEPWQMARERSHHVRPPHRGRA